MKTILQEITQATFFMSFLGMTGGALFMALQQAAMPSRLRSAAAVSSVLLTIAAISYYFMFNVYKDGIAQGGVVFPTQFRYMDWLLTTPLLLLEFPLMLGMGKRGIPFMTKLVILDILMIVFAFIAEITPGTPTIHYGFFFISCICWLSIAFMMLSALQSLPPRVGPSLRASLKFISFLFLIGWSVYPLGFLTPLMQIAPDIRELVYNIADVINKVGPALAIVFAGHGMLAEEAEALEERGYAPQESYAS